MGIASSMQRNLETEFLIPGDEEMQDYLRNGEDFGFTERRGHSLRLSTLVDLECRTTVGCAGALLTYLGRRRAVIYVVDARQESPTFSVSEMEMFSLENTM